MGELLHPTRCQLRMQRPPLMPPPQLMRSQQPMCSNNKPMCSPPPMCSNLKSNRCKWCSHRCKRSKCKCQSNKCKCQSNKCKWCSHKCKWSKCKCQHHRCISRVMGHHRQLLRSANTLPRKANGCRQIPRWSKKLQHSKQRKQQNKNSLSKSANEERLLLRRAYWLGGTKSPPNFREW